MSVLFSLLTDAMDVIPATRSLTSWMGLAIESTPAPAGLFSANFFSMSFVGLKLYVFIS